MARTKQTARGAKSSQPTRQEGMEPAVVEQQQEEVQVDEGAAQQEVEEEPRREPKKEPRREPKRVRRYHQVRR